MKVTLFALFVALLLVGCGEPDSSPPEEVLLILEKTEQGIKFQWGENPDQLTNDEVSEFVKNVSLSPKCKVTLRVNPEVPFAYTQQVMEQVASAEIAKLTFEPFGKQAVSLADPKGSYVVPLELPPQILINDDKLNMYWEFPSPSIVGDDRFNPVTVERADRLADTIKQASFHSDNQMRQLFLLKEDALTLSAFNALYSCKSLESGKLAKGKSYPSNQNGPDEVYFVFDRKSYEDAHRSIYITADVFGDSPPVFYFELFHNFGFPTQKCSLPEIQSLLEKRKERKVVLRINWNVPYKFVEQIMHKVVSAGKESILLQNFDEDYDPNHRKTFAVDLIIPNAGMNVGNIVTMESLIIGLSDEGSIYLNGSEIEDGSDHETPDLVGYLKAGKRIRDQLISSGVKTKEEAELRVVIQPSEMAPAGSIILALSACTEVGIEKVGFHSFTSSVPKSQKRKVVKLMQRQQKTESTLQQPPRTTEISDITLPDFNKLAVKDLGALTGIGLSLPKTMQQRCDPKKRLARLRSSGGKEMTETAIIRGLDWLKANQDPEGSWGDKDKDAMTGMALLAFLGHCELQDSPSYGLTVQKAIKYLTTTPSGKPVLFGNTGIYSHPIRTYALCEAFTMTKIKKLEEFVKKAVLQIIKSQKDDGGWSYGYDKANTASSNLSFTAWNMQALKAASLTGISFEDLGETMDEAIVYVKKCQTSDGKFALSIGGEGDASLTGAGVLCLQIWKNAKSKEAKKGLELMVTSQAKEWKQVNVQQWYYDTQACFQATGVSGGSGYWRAWNKDFQKIVGKAQLADGQWPHGQQYHGETAIFNTTMAILMLEVYYRNMPFARQ